MCSIWQMLLPIKPNKFSQLISQLFTSLMAGHGDDLGQQLRHSFVPIDLGIQLLLKVGTWR